MDIPSAARRWRASTSSRSKTAMTRKETLVFAARLAVTVILFYVIFRNIDLAKLLEAIKGAKPFWLVLPWLLYPIVLIIAAVKLKWLLEGFGLGITLGKSFALNWTAGFFNNFLPTSIGGDVYRLLYLSRKYPNRPAQVMSAV